MKVSRQNYNLRQEIGCNAQLTIRKASNDKIAYGL